MLEEQAGGIDKEGSGLIRSNLICTTQNLQISTKAAEVYLSRRNGDHCYCSLENVKRSLQSKLLCYPQTEFVSS